LAADPSCSGKYERMECSFVTDVVSPSVRSRMMAAIRGKNTKPEMIVRLGLHSRGFRFRLHDPNLPGKPDLVLPKYRAVIFVNGCFWHMHGCHLSKIPSSRPHFWREKLMKNKERDRDNVSRCIAKGWRVMIIWECALRGKGRLSVESILEQCEIWLRSNEPELSLEGENSSAGGGDTLFVRVAGKPG